MGKTIRLIHSNPEEGAERARTLERAGYTVAHEPLMPAILKELKQDPPAAVVIDLSRAPSQGRDFGVTLRAAKATRHVPIVFVGGEPAKVQRTRDLLPDATYTEWRRIRGALRRAIERPPRDPVVPRSSMAAYAGRPLPGKLGIEADCTVALVSAPKGFERNIGSLPSGVSIRRRAAGRPDITLWFVRAREELEAGLAKMRRFAEGGGLWIVWPKKSSDVDSDLTQAAVRTIAMNAGLVDFKICAVDATWSALRFTRRDEGE